MLEPISLELSLKAQAELLGLSRSSLYYRPMPPSPEEVAIKHHIDEIYACLLFYGSRRITGSTQPGRNRRFAPYRPALHARNGAFGHRPGPNTSKPAPAHKVYPVRLRHVNALYANHVWSIDITYIRLKGGWMYLVAIRNWFSRFVVAWRSIRLLHLTLCPKRCGSCHRTSYTHHLE